MNDEEKQLTLANLLSDPEVFKVLQNVVGIRYTTTKPTHTPNKEVEVWVYFDATDYFLEIWSNGAWRELKIGTVATPPAWKFGTAQRSSTAASGTQTIAHGLGKTPAYLRITAMAGAGTPEIEYSVGSYDGTTNSCVLFSFAVSVGGSTSPDTSNIIRIFDSGGANGQYASATLDATNITLSWTKQGSGSTDTNINFIWEVYG